MKTFNNLNCYRLKWKIAFIFLTIYLFSCNSSKRNVPKDDRFAIKNIDSGKIKFEVPIFLTNYYEELRGIKVNHFVYRYRFDENSDSFSIVIHKNYIIKGEDGSNAVIKGNIMENNAINLASTLTDSGYIKVNDVSMFRFTYERLDSNINTIILFSINDDYYSFELFYNKYYSKIKSGDVERIVNSITIN